MTGCASLMIQGTGSDAGKTVLVAALARALSQKGYRVRPFKPQNMSNNAAVTFDANKVGGGEIGRAQALQARACGVEPSVDMNPVLLKPEGEMGSQVILLGQRWGQMKARDYHREAPKLMPEVLKAYGRLQDEADIILVEGAGSPAEINLRQGDIANMGFAHAAGGIPVALCCDIDRGGSLAMLAGTHHILAQQDRDLIKGYIVNRFRGDPSLFHPAVEQLKGYMPDWQNLGLMPFVPAARYLPAEDALDIEKKSSFNGSKSHKIKIYVPRLARIANYDDLDPFIDDDVELEIIQPGRAIPQDGHLIILLGSKTTIADLAHLKAEGWDIDIKSHLRQGGSVLGLCGGYQMLGHYVHDHSGLEGNEPTIEGLGLLPIETHFKPYKNLARHEDNGVIRYGFNDQPISGYEIHLGETRMLDPVAGKNNDDFHPMLNRDDGGDRGLTSKSGQIMGCYIHGIFKNDDFRHYYLSGLSGDRVSKSRFEDKIDYALDALADAVNQHLHMDRILKIAGL